MPSEMQYHLSGAAEVRGPSGYLSGKDLNPMRGTATVCRRDLYALFRP